MNFIAYLFIGIIIGIVIERYIFPIIDLKLEVLQYKESEKATIYQLNAQELLALFNREYPELNDTQKPELTPAIGFIHNSPDEDMYYEEENCKNKIGYIKGE